MNAPREGGREAHRIEGNAGQGREEGREAGSGWHMGDS